MRARQRIFISMKILNELAYAEKLLEQGFSRYMYGGDLYILAKYYRYLGVDEKQIERNLISFCEKFEKSFDVNANYKNIEWNLKKSRKSKLRIPVDVPITINELNIIKNLNNYRYEKILFTLLVLAKYFRITNTSVKVNKKITEENDAYIIYNKFNFILKHSHTCKRKDENIKHYFVENNYIKYSQDGKGIIILFAKPRDGSDVVLTVTKIENIIDFYPVFCEYCGEIIENKSKMHSMHDECYKFHRNEKDKEKKRKWWNKNKTRPE
jgi:hypothetical protein